ncbi:MAG: CaiB/BaiF CoA transferase family protein [Rhodoblastus sp.]
MDATTGALPLHGIRVLELGQYIAGPGAGMILCELGADVVKVEPLEGDQARHVGRFGKAMIRGYNRSKRSLAIDLKDRRGREAVLQLAASCDVVIQNLRPGAVERLGLGPAELRKRFPRLIYLSVVGFGSQGPSANRPGFDVAAQAESGLMSITGEPERLPQKVGAPIIDSSTAHVAAQAVLAALFRRERENVGQAIEISLLDVAMHLQLANWSDFLGGGPEPRRIGNGQPYNAPAADLVRTRDGHIVLSAYPDEHWARFCRLVGREDMIADPRFESNEKRVAHRADMLKALDDILSDRSSEECIALLGGNGIVAGAVRSYAQTLESADVQASGIVICAQGRDNGEGYQSLGLPDRMVDLPRRDTVAAPEVGADSIGVLAEAGFTPAQIRDLQASRVIVQAGSVGAPSWTEPE